MFNFINEENRLSLDFKLVMYISIVVVISGIIMHFLMRYDEYNSMRNQSIFLGKYFNEYTSEVLSSDFVQTRKTINKYVDDAFTPVYNSVSKMADLHYTIKGQYAELMAGYFEEKVSEVMLKGLDKRIEQANETVHKVYHEEILSKTRVFHQENNDDLNPLNMRAAKEMLDLVVKDAKLRFTTPEMILTRAATLGIAATAGAYTYKRIASIIAKHAGKRAPGTGSAIIKGAAIGGSTAGLAGAVIGAGIAGVTVWLAADVVIIRIDEYLNRDEFEDKLRTIIDNYRDELKLAMFKQVNKTNMELAELTPYDLIKE